jgi:hypothetical protein
LTFLCLTSWKSERDRKIVGLYGDCKNGYLVCDQLLLNNDSTFKYALFYDVGGWRIWMGKWKVKSDTIILNTFSHPAFKLNSIFESVRKDTDYLTIQIYNMEIPATNARIEINDGELIRELDFFGRTIIYGNIKPKKIKIHNTNWSECVLVDSIFTISNMNSNYIEIHTKPYNNYLSEYMVDTKWIIKGKMIYPWRTWKGEYSKLWSLKRTKPENIKFE